MNMDRDGVLCDAEFLAEMLRDAAPADSARPRSEPPPAKPAPAEPVPAEPAHAEPPPAQAPRATPPLQHRAPPGMANRTKPNALDATSFEFNEPGELDVARSFVTISDKSLWGRVELECIDPSGSTAPQRKHSKDSVSETCCMFTVNEGRWRFRGSLPESPPEVEDLDQLLRIPVAFVELKVKP